jgi:hypothetical protein
VEKTTMKIKYGSYEFLVMPFRLCNVLSTFTTFMDSIFHEKLDEFVIIYIDDILVYSKTTKKHKENLEYVLSKFYENNFFVNTAKNEFAQEEMDFLGHILSWEGVKLDPKKLQTTQDWKRIIMVKGVRSFLGLANFYWKFIKGFS